MMEPFDLLFDLHLFFQTKMLLAKTGHVVYFSQLQLLVAKTNEDRIINQKFLCVNCRNHDPDIPTNNAIADQAKCYLCIGPGLGKYGSGIFRRGTFCRGTVHRKKNLT